MEPLDEKLDDVTAMAVADGFTAGEPMFKGPAKGIEILCGHCSYVVADGVQISQILGGQMQCPGCRKWNKPVGGT